MRDTTIDEPATLAAAAERDTTVLEGPGDRFAGYGVLGVSFASGDVLALRRYPVASRGPGYTSVWHQSPDGRWTFYSDVPIDQGCVPYYRPGIDETIVAPIRLEWRGARRLSVAVDGGRRLAWSMWLTPTVGTGAVNLLIDTLPDGWWHHRSVAAVAGAISGFALGTGRLRLAGRTPTGHRFVSAPSRIWTVPVSRATVAGRDLGCVAPLSRKTTLGDLLIPRRGLLAFGETLILPPDNSAEPRTSTS